MNPEELEAKAWKIVAAIDEEVERLFDAEIEQLRAADPELAAEVVKRMTPVVDGRDSVFISVMPTPNEQISNSERVEGLVATISIRLSEHRRRLIVDMACNDAEVIDCVRRLYRRIDEQSHVIGPGIPPQRKPLPNLSGTRFGPFDVISEIGRGGMGVVYEAIQRSLGRRVALKIKDAPIFGIGFSMPAINRDDVEQPGDQEGRLQSKLDDDGIARVFDAGTDFVEVDTDRRELSWIAVELVDGGTDIVAYSRGQELKTAESVRLLMLVAQAIGKAHAVGVVHRDLKPGNILVDRKGRPKVIDFGISTPTEIDPDRRIAGVIAGTLGYLPAECLKGESIDERARDVYALGSILYELIAGRPLFSREPKETLIERILADERTEIPPNCPDDLREIVQRATHPHAPGYATAAMFAADLNAYLESRPPSFRGLRFGDIRGIWNGSPMLRYAVVATAIVTAVTVVDLCRPNGFIRSKMRRGVEERTERLARLIEKAMIEVALDRLSDADETINGISKSEESPDVTVVRSILQSERGDVASAATLLESARLAGCDPTLLAAAQCRMPKRTLSLASPTAAASYEEKIWKIIGMANVPPPHLYIEIAKAVIQCGERRAVDDPRTEALIVKLESTAKRYCEVRRMVGCIEKLRGRFDEALAQFDRAEAEGLEPKRLAPDRATTHLLAGNPTEARKILPVLEGSAPTDLRSAFVAGVVEATSGEFDRAAGFFESAVRLQPEDGASYANLGLMHSRRGRFDEAFAAYEESLRLRPDHAPTRHNFGAACTEASILAKNSDPEREIRLLCRARDLLHSATASFNYALALKNRGRLRDSLVVVDESIGLERTGRAFYLRAEIKKLLEFAGLHFVDDLREAVGLEPLNYDYHRSYLEALCASESYDRAWIEMARWIEHETDASRSVDDLLRLLPGGSDSSGDRIEAIVRLSTRQPINSVKDVFLVRAAYLLLDKSGQTAAATAACRQLIEKTRDTDLQKTVKLEIGADLDRLSKNEK